MSGNPISVAGIEIPSNSPFFLTLITIHVMAALTCVIAGIVAMLFKKQRGNHSNAGIVYYRGLQVVFITVIIISIIRWKEDYHLFILGLLSISAATIGRLAAKRKWNKWILYHVPSMGFSFIILLTAFYVDNGRFLPIWKDFPTIIYWILPTIVGSPIIIITLLRHPVIKKLVNKKIA